MPGISIAGVPKWYSPGYRYGPYTKKTNDPEEIEKMRLAVEADTKDCPACIPGNPVRHYSGYVKDDEAYTYRCLSYSRHYNPDTGKMEGSAHCTCDYCF